MIPKRELDELIRINAKKVEEILNHGDARIREKAQILKKYYDDNFDQKAIKEGVFKQMTIKELQDMIEDEKIVETLKKDEKTRIEIYAEEVEENPLLFGKVDEKTTMILAPISEYMNLKVLKEVQRIIEKGLYKKEEVKEVKKEPVKNEEIKREPVRRSGPPGGPPLLEDEPVVAAKPASPKKEFKEERKEQKREESPTDEELLRRSREHVAAKVADNIKIKAQQAGLSVEEYRRKIQEDVKRRIDERARELGKSSEQIREEAGQRTREAIAKRAAEAHMTPEQYKLQRQKSLERRIIERERERELKEGNDKSPKSPKKG